MAVIYAAALRTTRMNSVVTAIDTGAGANGTMELGTTGMAAALSTHALSAPPSATVTGDVLTFNAIADDTSADATGEAAEARIKDRDGNVIVSGLTVGTSGTDVIIDNPSIVAGQTVKVNSGTLTHNTSGV